MRTFTRQSAAALLMATAAAGAWALGEQARIQANPPGVPSADSSATSAAPALGETWISTPAGVVRQRAQATDAAGSDRSGVIDATNASRATAIAGPGGQRVWVLPGESHDPRAVAAQSAPPAGALVIDLGRAKLLWMPGMADGVQGPLPTPAAIQAQSATAPLPRGTRIVNLPPGAVAPAGMPEVMTLYRATAAPAVARGAR